MNINYVPKFIDDTEASTLFQVLQSNISWNKLNYFKRSICHYEGNVPQLNQIILQVQNNFQGTAAREQSSLGGTEGSTAREQSSLGRSVEGVFLNYYENGNDYAPYHADKYNCDTCLISLGETRILRYKHNTTGENTDYNLANGDLLFIPDEINNNYKHSLLKRTKITGSRISILLFFK